MQATEKQARTIVNIATRRLWWRSDGEMYRQLAALLGKQTLSSSDDEVAALAAAIDKQTASEIIDAASHRQIEKAINLIKAIGQ